MGFRIPYLKLFYNFTFIDDFNLNKDKNVHRFAISEKGRDKNRERERERERATNNK